ncbi:amidohydrolase 2 [Reticulomyxa filosa]|uniref:Amidohydrolase 2 n=1 Tax=Reticulomyxa filosa TaxID=46433 RepID=X6PAT5_RETFI|nr:amidohydrolase 2 [Reticulomyxa filosa]|eukprot:ETO35179.1 amidohydrolase 2 [Reticulomyxa filosa]
MRTRYFTRIWREDKRNIHSVPTKRLISDAHFHLWNPESNPWLKSAGIRHHPAGDLTPVARNYDIVEYQQESKKYTLSACVHIQAAHKNSIQETAMLQSLYNKYGFPNGIIGYVCLLDENTSHVETQLRYHIAFDNFRGIRFMLDYHEKKENRRQTESPVAMTTPIFHKNLKLLSKYDLSFDLQVYPSQLSNAAVMCAAHSNIRFVVNHMGLPLKNEMSQWRQGIKLLSACENVYVKFSGWPMLKKKTPENA